MLNLVPIEDIGGGGIISDIEPYQLQPNQWSGGQNVRFKHGAVIKVKGYAEVMKDCPIEPWHLGTYQSHSFAGKIEQDGFYWVVFGDEEVWVSHNDVWSNITRQDEDGEIVPYNTVEGSNWEVGVTGALLIATNGIDPPQYWPLDDNNKADTSIPLKTLDEWPEDDLSVETISGFKSYIITTNVRRKTNEGVGVELQNRLVKWSTAGSQYKLPQTWDVYDYDQDAGEYELLETQGPIVDALPLGDMFVVYKTDSIHLMSFIGNPYIFSFKMLDPDIGLLTKGAITTFPGGHFFMSNNDCFVNNGQTITPILNGKVRKQLFNDLNGDHYDRSFCVTDALNHEIWVAYPTSSSLFCNRAMVWNYVENVFSFRTLPNVTDIKPGVKRFSTNLQKDDPSNITWGSISAGQPDTIDPCMPDAICVPWNGDYDAPWGALSYENVVNHLIYCAPGDVETGVKKGLYRDGVGEMEDGKFMYSYVQRTGIDLGDPSAVKHITAIWPKIYTTDSDHANTMRVYVGSQMATDEPVKWRGPYTYDPNLQSKVSVRVTGKFLAVRVASTSDMHWSISALEFEVTEAGRRGRRVYG